MDKVKNLGQVFTSDQIVNFMGNLCSKDTIDYALEPCAGEGVFLKYLEQHPGVKNIDAFEIDTTLENVSNVPITHESFLSSKHSYKYDLVIGNPPYVRWKNILKPMKEEFKSDDYWSDKINGQSDLLYAFLFKSIDLLKENGELIFITPSFWTQTKHSKKVREYLISKGYLELIIDFNEIRMFKNVSSNIIIFKFVKCSKNKENKPPIKIVNFKTKKYYDDIFNDLNNILKELDACDLIDNDVVEAFTCDQFKNNAPFKPVPSNKEKMIEQIEKSSTVNAPKIKVSEGNSDITKSLNEVYTKREVDFLSVDIKNFKKVKFCDETYYIFDNVQTKLIANPVPPKRYVGLGDIVKIGNGMVSGLDKAFKVTNDADFTDDETINVAKANNLDQYSNKNITRYIFVNDVETLDILKKEHINVYNQLINFEENLMKRYCYNRDIPYWHWVFLRNKHLMEESTEKIFVPCKERIDKRGYIRFALVEGNVYATQDVTALVKKSWVKEDIRYILALLNSDLLFTWIKYKGLIRGGVAEFSEEPLSYIPIRLIDWDNPVEVDIHNEIVELTQKIINKKSKDEEYNTLKQNIEKKVEELYL